MVDWNKPVNADAASGVLSTLVTQLQALTKWNIADADTNIPTDALRHSTTTDRLIQQYNGASWDNFGFLADPDWQTWTPTYGASGGTISSTTTETAVYYKIGPIVFFALKFSGTLASSPTLVLASFPSTAVASFGMIYPGLWDDSTVNSTIAKCFLNDATQVGIQRDNSAAFNNLATTFWVSGFYEEA